MLNLYEHSLTANYNRMECNGLLFVEYKCLPGESEFDSLWSPHGHLVYVTKGNKKWITPEGEIPAEVGEAVYCKKGACIMQNFYETDFCALLFFFPKDFIKEVVLEFEETNGQEWQKDLIDFHLLKVNMDQNLKIFFESVSSYFFQQSIPSKHLLKLKFKELILQVMTSAHNPQLKAYFLSIIQEGRDNIEAVMRKNLLFDLSINDYAKLCNRSLSSFKRDFKQIFGMSPLQWILEERLKYARIRLLTTTESINDIAFYSGFESPSHFIRCFKKRYGHPPLKFRMEFKSE